MRWSFDSKLALRPPHSPRTGRLDRPISDCAGGDDGKSRPMHPTSGPIGKRRSLCWVHRGGAGNLPSTSQRPSDAGQSGGSPPARSGAVCPGRAGLTLGFCLRSAARSAMAGESAPRDRPRPRRWKSGNQSATQTIAVGIAWQRGPGTRGNRAIKESRPGANRRDHRAAAGCEPSEKPPNAVTPSWWSGVSHEMKPPLAGIKAYVELLADGDAEQQPFGRRIPGSHQQSRPIDFLRLVPTTW